MELVSLCGAIAVALTLTISVSYILGDPQSLAQTLSRLGLKLPLARLVSRSAPVLELGASALVLAGIEWVSSGVLLVGALVFFYAGIRGLWSGRPIPCNCFGAQKGSSLGSLQLVTASLFLTVFLLSVLYPLEQTFGEWLISYSAVILAAMMARLAEISPLLLTLRSARIKLSREYPV